LSYMRTVYILPHISVSRRHHPPAIFKGRRASFDASGVAKAENARVSEIRQQAAMMLAHKV